MNTPDHPTTDHTDTLAPTEQPAPPPPYYPPVTPAPPPWRDPAYDPRARQRERRPSRLATWLLGALLIFAGLFSAFAAGMITERSINGSSQAEAAEGGAPASIDRAWDLVHSQYVDPSVIDDELMTEAAIDGMLETLKDEGHTRYLTPEEANAESESLSGEYIGVGIQVETTDEDRIVVVAPIDDSPAQEAGVRPGDLLLSVDGRDITSMTVDTVLPMIRGEEGTQVTLAFEREGESQPLVFTLTRRKIESSAVSWTMLEGNIADIRLSQFSDGAGDDMEEAINEAKAAGATAFIFDLRNNPGGYIDEALHVGSLFVPEGSTIFQSQVRDGTRTPHNATTRGATTGDLPLVVLINEGSASSSEIVSGAIQEHNPHATVVGETTFGTGTVLSSFGLGDGSSLLLGTELWLTPDGTLIKNQGIRPDVLVGLPESQVPFVPVSGREPGAEEITENQLQYAIEVIESGQAGEQNPTFDAPPSRRGE
jgi:carboxyl-terminal processing protease